MNYAITGASGFIGSYFHKYLSENHCIESRILSSKSTGNYQYSLDNYSSLERCLSDIDILIHCAFDHTYKSNISGILNIVKACEKNNVKRLIYISTISVYDFPNEKVLTEHSAYSKLNDPYTTEKIKIEKILISNCSDLEIVILQPTIVYGSGGNWTRFAFDACLHEAIRIPLRGRGYCNAVYIRDVARAIWLSSVVKLNERVSRYLIASDEVISWQDFYELHSKSNLNLRKLEFFETKRQFHENVVFNFLFLLWYRTYFGCFLNIFVSRIKKYRAIKIARDKHANQVDGQLEKKIQREFCPIGITRYIHSGECRIDSSKAYEELGFICEWGRGRSFNELRDIRHHA